MKTFAIYETFESQCRLLILDGDYRHLNDVIINCGDYTDSHSQLHDLLFDEDGNFVQTEYGTDEWSSEMRALAVNEFQLIKIGFAP